MFKNVKKDLDGYRLHPNCMEKNMAHCVLNSLLSGQTSTKYSVAYVPLMLRTSLILNWFLNFNSPDPVLKYFLRLPLIRWGCKSEIRRDFFLTCNTVFSTSGLKVVLFLPHYTLLPKNRE